jgi:asparagine synthase (glutamine-hydrolysing)
MCGIAGFLATRGSAESARDAVAAMCDAQAHRGPDADGLIVSGAACLGHRRLSIIDLRPEAGQPMQNEDGTIWLVVNGEFYDFQRTRDDLAARGHVFRSNSDSEIAIHLYEEEGPRFVEKLRGMFAIALWDARQGRLVLARDRFGKKPLHWHFGPQGLAFASELQALAASGMFPLQPDVDAIDAYLGLQYVPAPITVYRGVHKLPPGHLAVVTPGREPKPEPYFRLDYGRKGGRSLDDVTAELRNRLDEAVRIRMVSDVPLGAFLSGGIDSATVVALMARSSSLPVKTFSIGFTGDTASELPFARLVAQRYATDHHELVVTPEMVDVVPRLARHFGEPFADCSAVPTWYLSRFTRESVTVALSGDAGDEGFGGYSRYRHARIARAVRSLPPPLPRLAAAALATLPSPRMQPVRDFGRRLMGSEVERYLGLVAHFAHEDRLALYAGDLKARFATDTVAAGFEAVLAAATGPDAADRLMELDVATYLPGAILPKVDVTSMAHALEVRCPLLDQEVMAFAASLPSGMKLNGLKSKFVLRRAVADLLPPGILHKPKRGFDIPVDRWMRGELAPMTRDLLLDGTARSRGLFEPAAVERLMAAHARGESRGLQLWTLLMLEQWFRTFVDSRPNGGRQP